MKPTQTPDWIRKVPFSKFVSLNQNTANNNPSATTDIACASQNLVSLGQRNARLATHNLSRKLKSEVREGEMRLRLGCGLLCPLLIAIIRKVMNWQASRTDDFVSPVVRGMARTQEKARDRVLTDDEIRKVWGTGNGMFGAYVRFLLLTAARRNEVAHMTWAEIEGSDWTLPARRNKTGVDLVRPLSRAARHNTRKLPGVALGCTTLQCPANVATHYRP
jgi:integrase